MQATSPQALFASGALTESEGIIGLAMTSLREELQQALTKLSVFPGRFDDEWAAHVMDVEPAVARGLLQVSHGQYFLVCLA